MRWLYYSLRPFLFLLDAETAHRLVLRCAAMASRNRFLRALLGFVLVRKKDPKLTQKVFGIEFENPVGLAAGLDKDGEAIDFWASVGFGFIELGTVTPGEGQPGNERPRIARVVTEEAIVNRMGFPNHGAKELANRMQSSRCDVPIGVNIGKAKLTPNADAAGDYIAALQDVVASARYIAINVSSPNTPGLRELQTIQALEPLLRAVLVERDRLTHLGDCKHRPVLLKIAPDLADEDIDAMADLAKNVGVDGLIVTNTTINHQLLKCQSKISGGISGAPLRSRALELTRRLYLRLQGQVPIISVGGIMNADDAWDRICAGATLIQIYTGLIYEGPGLVSSVLAGLSKRIAEAGLQSIEDAVGLDIRRNVKTARGIDACSLTPVRGK